MPSFDIVCKTDLQEADNAINGVRREVDQRYDFKGAACSIERQDASITILADDQYKLDQIQQMLKAHATKRKIDAKSLDFKTPEQASGNSLRQSVEIKQGVSSDEAKHIVKEIKAMKLKVQASIRGEEVRVEGKKRDDLQQVMALVKEKAKDLPLQFVNFRD